MAFGDLAYRCHPSRTALIVVDVQRDFCEASPGLDKPVACDVDEAVGELASLIDAARAHEVPVVFVRTIHDRASDSVVWRARRRGLADYEHERCRPGTAGAEFYGVAPVDGEAVVVKHRYDAFLGTGLDQLLRARQREAVIVAGVTTDVCVETAIRHATNLDYLSTLAHDCSAAMTPDDHEQAVARIAQNFGLVATGKEIAALWE